MSNTPASLALTGVVLRTFTHPPPADITLAYYLEPVWWQSSDSERFDALKQLLEREAALLGSEQPASLPISFRKARAFLVLHGFPAAHIHIEADWRQPELISRRKTQFTNGFFSSVIIVRHHYDMLFGLLGIPLRHVLNQFGHQVQIHILDLSGQP